MINLNEPYDVYVATEVGNVSNGGVSKWVDDWVNNVAPHLIVKPILILEIEQQPDWINFVEQFVDVIHRPGSTWEWEYTMSQLPIANYFSLPDRRTVDMVIKGARKFHLLSYPLPIMMYGNSKDWSVEKMRKIYKRKIDSVCIHSLESETLKYQQKLRKFTKKSLGYQQKSIDFQNSLIKDSETSIWIGLDNEEDFDFMIPNVYKFEHNLSAVDSNIVGFPARCEPRKNLHYLQKIESIALTSEVSFKSSFDDYRKKVKFSNLKIKDYRADKIESFYKRDDWGISHSCFENEPFGYGIFQSIDFGKIPILHKNWCKKMKYPFRASTQKQFEKQYAEISNLSVEDRNTYLGDLRDYLSKYSSIGEWRDKLLSIYNQDGDQVWLPTSLSPSKNV
tara:strand:- start:180 stop:1355 length:1176 start_codon:yes stop_codon:yes gene_type:complete